MKVILAQLTFTPYRVTIGLDWVGILFFSLFTCTEVSPWEGTGLNTGLHYTRYHYGMNLSGRALVSMGFIIYGSV
jgi:hypothetical protein